MVAHMKPRAHCRPWERGEVRLSGTPFIWEEQRDTVSISIRVVSTHCCELSYLGSDKAQRYGFNCWAAVISRQKNKAI